MLTWFIVFCGIFLLVATIQSRDDSSALIQSVAITLYFYIVGMFVTSYGFPASIVGFIAGFFVIQKIMKYDLGDAFLMLLACQAIQAVASWGVEKYLS